VDVSRLLIVSNRVAIPDRTGAVAAGGLAVALGEAFRMYEGVWFGWSGKVAAEPASRPQVINKGQVQYALMDLTTSDRREYYNGFANRALWPTMHYRVGLSDFSRTDYDGYRRVNHNFATALANSHQIEQLAARANSSRVVRQMSADLNSRRLIIGVDRLDYSKGIPERMGAYERFLQDNPDQRGRVTYLQIAPTSRSEVPEYAAVSRAVNEALGRINGSLGEPGWVPIHYVTSTYPRSVLAGLYRLASVGLVTPMRDGMNLVAKEYVAAQDPANPGVLILSKFAGAAQQLRAALIVNPNDKVEVAEAIRNALHMTQRERVCRWSDMMQSLREHDVSWWAGAFLKALKRGSPSALKSALSEPPFQHAPDVRQPTS
jgi:trehalose-6-phosphate synthase